MTTNLSTPLSRRHLLLTAATSTAVAALASGAEGPRPDAPAPRPEDVAGIDAIFDALYGVISGPKGKPRDWDRMRGLFVPGARLIPCRPGGADGKVAIATLTVEDYIARSGPTLVEKGFVERQVARRVDRFGHLAQVFSTYDAARRRTGPAGPRDQRDPPAMGRDAVVGGDDHVGRRDADPADPRGVRGQEVVPSPAVVRPVPRFPIRVL